MAVYEPSIAAVAISPNPANINQSFLISVSVTEVEIIMYRVSRISGAAISGQTVNPAASIEEV